MKSNDFSEEKQSENWVKTNYPWLIYHKATTHREKNTNFCVNTKKVKNNN